MPSAISPTPDVTSGIYESEAPPPIQGPLEDNERPHIEDIPIIPPGPVVETLPKSSASQTFLSLFRVNCWIVFFSIWGTLARLGLIGLTDYEGAPIGSGRSKGNGVVWANFAGCVMMGFLIEDLRLFSLEEQSKEMRHRPRENRQSGAINDTVYDGSNNSGTTSPNKPLKVDKSTIPLYIGLTTGFCGSFTSFSSYMLQSSLYLCNTLPDYTHQEKGYSVLSFLAYIILTFALSISGLQFGAQLAVFTQPYTPSIPKRMVRVLDGIIPLLALGVWTGSILMAALVKEWRGTALFACVFSPLGALARFWLSRFLNPRLKQFPLGTFTVNIIGSAVLAGAIVGQYGHMWTTQTGGVLGCQLLRGVSDGFCGCLTTVSTWVVEIRGLRSMLFLIHSC